MKTKEKKTEKNFDTVKTFREIKDKISNDLFGKSTEQILEYLKQNSLKLTTEKQGFHTVVSRNGKKCTKLSYFFRNKQYRNEDMGYDLRYLLKPIKADRGRLPLFFH